MRNVKNVVLGLVLSFGLFAGGLLVSTDSFVAYAKLYEGKNHDGKKGHKGSYDKKGPCAEIECEAGDKFCYGKKKECKSKMFQKKLDEAKKKGLNADKLAQWIAGLEQKIARKKEKLVDMQARIQELEANLNEVKSLKVK